MITNFEFKIWFLSKFFFQTRSRLILSTYRILIISTSFWNRHFLSRNMKFDKRLNDVNQIIRQKLNNIFNRIFKIFMNKLMTHLINLFQVCVALNYHLRCFRKIHIIILKKSRKKNYTNVKTYKSIAFLNTFDKILKSIIAWCINDLTKIHNFFFDNQMNKRKNRNCETILKLLTKQIHTIWNMNKDKITILLNMNVIKTYDHVSREKLLHNLKKRRISTWIIAWTNNFIQNRKINFIVKAKQILWITLTSTYRENYQCHQYCIYFTTRICWNFLNNHRVKWLSLILWTTSTFSFMISTRSTIVNC
jgi:hypothetical protein